MTKNLNTKTNQFEAIINFPLKGGDDKLLNDLVQYLSAEPCKYSFIVHSKDTNDNGQLKTKHIHLICCYPKDQRKMLFTWLNILANVLSVKPENVQISVCPAYLLPSRIQYLVHKNDKDKYQYPEKQIITNYDNDELQSYLASEITTELTIDQILNYCKKGYTLTEIYQVIGIAQAIKYRNIIRDIHADYNKRQLPF